VCLPDHKVRKNFDQGSHVPRTFVFGDMLGEFYGQATKGVRWMPWRQQTMKDVASCDKPRGAASRL
jgi:hypothetical protein